MDPLRIQSAGTLTDNPVKNNQGQDLGNITEIMLDLEHGRIAYAVLSFGGFMGVGNKLFALPWSSLKLDTRDHSFILHVSKETLEQSGGFDPSDWPDFADPAFRTEVYAHYGASPYWP